MVLRFFINIFSLNVQMLGVNTPEYVMKESLPVAEGNYSIEKDTADE